MLLQLFIFAGFLVVNAPAALIDWVVRQQTSSRIALVMTHGSVWSGHAQLATFDPVAQRYRALLPIDWRWRPAALLQGRLAWQVSLASVDPFEIRLTPAGIQSSALSVHLPVRPLFEQLPDAVGRLGWHGDLSVHSPAWQCSWRGRCEGSLTLGWNGSAIDILPGRFLGDYTLNLTAVPSGFQLNLTTTAGPLNITGVGAWKSGERPGLSGTITGASDLLSRFSGAEGKWIKKGEKADSLKFSI